MAGPLSGADALKPAFERTKFQLFKPFRFERWARLAVVCFLTGELTGGGGGGFNLPFNTGRGRTGSSSLAGPFGLPGPWADYLPLIVVGFVLLFLILIFFIYVSSVFRFILFDSVLYDRCRLREGWRRWQQAGASYFLWQIGFGLASMAALALTVGVPVLWAWRAGMFHDWGGHLVGLILGGIVVVLLFLAVVITSAVIGLFAKDFVIPVMALENVGVIEGWRRVLPRLGAEKGAYAIYVLIKMALALGAAVLFVIINILVVLMFIIPVLIAGAIVFVVAMLAGATWNAVTISLAVGAGVVVVLALVFLLAMVSAPAMVFFQAYTLHFYGGRYPALGSELAKTPPVPPPAAPPAVSPVTPPPAPAPAV